MKKTKREIVKRLRFNGDQALQLEKYLNDYDLRFTDFVHKLISQELHIIWPMVAVCKDDAHTNSIAQGLKLKKKRSTKNNSSRPVPRADPMLLLELGRIGNNINQIARSLNFICLQKSAALEKLSFIDCLDILATIQSELNSCLPSIPNYYVSPQLSEKRKKKAILLVSEKER
ncbi:MULTISPECIES: plasmid mobilization relaxosome protein MobC [unclassified Acinetobacter]|uniref:plasmid mobilization relaxosome protein MobC n=1 Tax=unclassified Acinetobacter TaxID=196816 RepID=UPI0015D43D87|nr:MULTISPECIES: plasmid mobilization relaxosome protein MobC [unclassified Acinetobacter]